MVESSQLALLLGFELEQTLSLLWKLDCRIISGCNSINSSFCKEDMGDAPNDQVLFVAFPQLQYLALMCCSRSNFHNGKAVLSVVYQSLQ